MFDFKILLGSNSPRRKQLLSDAGFVFETMSPDIDEEVPEDLVLEMVPVVLSQQKAEKILTQVHQDTYTIITADTVVINGKKIMNKPMSPAEAESMLKSLSGKEHKVVTGFTIVHKGDYVSDCAETYVKFRQLTDQEIQYYIKNYKPFDKAGSYGIQDWIGLVGVEEIKGCYYNVMGLPVSKIYTHLSKLV
ncbi:MAG: Maf family protein [Cytophagales bacterium]